MTPQERLNAILTQGRINAYPPYGTTWPTVCLSESDELGTGTLIQEAGFQPWGVVLPRNWVWDAGGGPVWYVRDELFHGVRSVLSEPWASWVVRTSPGSSDWLHEREWRIPCDPEYPYLDLPDDGPLAIIVADEDWEPDLEIGFGMNPYNGKLGAVAMTPRRAYVDRWLWTGDHFELLGPVGRIEPAG